MAQAWQIVGYDSDGEILRQELPEGQLTEDEVKALLQRLASRHLTDEEVVSASTGGRRDLELMRLNGKRLGWSTTGNPHYVASAATE